MTIIKQNSWWNMALRFPINQKEQYNLSYVSKNIDGYYYSGLCLIYSYLKGFTWVMVTGYIKTQCRL